METTVCTNDSETEIYCFVPKLSAHLEDILYKPINNSRKKRGTESIANISLEIILHLDGVRKGFSILYFRDPSFSAFEETNKVKEFTPSQPKLTIKVGKYFCLFQKQK